MHLHSADPALRKPARSTTPMWEGSVLFFSPKKIRHTLAFLFVRLAFFLMLPVATPSQTAQTSNNLDRPSKEVLLLYGTSDRTPAGEVQDRLLRQTLTTYNGSLNIFAENMDDTRVGGDSGDELQAELFRQKYKKIRFDVIIAIKSPALAFALEHRGDVFGNPPIVFCDVNSHEEVLRRLAPGVGGAVVDLDIDSFLSLIQKVQPQVTQVALVVGDSPAESELLKDTNRRLDAEPRLSVDYWVGLTLEEARTKIASVPKKSAILYTTEYLDHEGHYFIPKDFLAQIAPYSAAPVYSISSTYLGTGTVGGMLYDPASDVKTATDLAIP